VRSYYLLKVIAARHDTDVWHLGSDLAPLPPDLGIRQVRCYKKDSALRWLLSPQALGLPVPFRRYYSGTICRALRTAAAAYDAIICDHLMTTFAVADLVHDHVLLLEHNAEYAVWFDRAEITFGIRQSLIREVACQMLAYERNQVSRCAAVAFPSAHDSKLLQGWARTSFVLENGVDIATNEYCERLTAEPRLLFVGSLEYFANIDALTWFLDRVFPIIREAVPLVALDVVGFHAPRRARLPLARLAMPNVFCHFNVSDVSRFYNRSRVALVPLRAGSGSRLKMLESMALGTPLVSTRKGAEGLDVQPGRHFLLADAPDDFAESVLRLLRDDGLATAVRRDARSHVCSRYDWPLVTKSLTDKLAAL
jgi:glycosyltransferase involved in cell wall biosynthesis